MKVQNPFLKRGSWRRRKKKRLEGTLNSKFQNGLSLSLSLSLSLRPNSLFPCLVGGGMIGGKWAIPGVGEEERTVMVTL